MEFTGEQINLCVSADLGSNRLDVIRFVSEKRRYLGREILLVTRLGRFSSATHYDDDRASTNEA